MIINANTNDEKLALLKSILKSTDDGYLVIDTKGHVSAYNRRFLKMWKIPKALADEHNDKKLLNCAIKRLKNPKEFLKKVNYLYKHPKQSSRDNIFFKDGRVFERYSTAQILDDKIVGRVWNFRDVTEQDEMLNILYESEKRFHALFESVDSCVAIYKAVDDGKDFVFIDFNKTAQKVEQINKSQVIGKRVTEVFPYVKKFGLLKVFQQVYKNGRSQKHPIGLYKDNRISGWRENYVYKLSSGEIVSVYEDKTAEKKAEELLKEANRNLKQIDELRFLMLRDVAHELKTPSSIIKMASGSLLEEFKRRNFDKVKMMEFLEIIARNADHFNKQIGAMVELSRYGNIKQVKNKKIDICKIVESVHREYQLLSETRKIRFDLNVKGNPMVLGNKNLLERMIKNLVDNAFKYTKKGYIVISCYQRGKSVVVSVKDSGIGMHKNNMKNLFKPFMKADPSTEGMGIGLSTVDQIVKLYKGKIKVKSIPGKGSIFSIFLPKKINNSH